METSPLSIDILFNRTVNCRPEHENSNYFNRFFYSNLHIYMAPGEGDRDTSFCVRVPAELNANVVVFFSTLGRDALGKFIRPCFCFQFEMAHTIQNFSCLQENIARIANAVQVTL